VAIGFRVRLGGPVALVLEDRLQISSAQVDSTYQKPLNVGGNLLSVGLMFHFLEPRKKGARSRRRLARSTQKMRKSLRRGMLAPVPGVVRSMMQMSEPSSPPSSPPRIAPVSEPPAADKESSEIASLRKEIIEARNLVIKTDNLLKNLHAEMKKLGARHDEQEKRHWMTSVTAYAAFAVLAGVGAIAYARAEVRTAREEAQAAEAHARALQQDAEKIKSGEVSRREANERAFRIYEVLGSEKEGPGLNQVMSHAMHLDKSQLSSLEARAIEDRAAVMRVRLAQAALERGNSAFRRQDWAAVSTELGRYVELDPKSAEPNTWYHLGQARIQTKEFQAAVVPLENFLKTAGTGKTAQYAGLLLGQAYEESGNAAKAREAYERAERLYPGSDYAPMIRNRLRRLGALSPAAPTKP
jgi:tetratricopeptide (TPR) repeat protein